MDNSAKQSIKINQLLYGYDEGHRLLAGSIKPERQSAKTLLTFSDLSGQGLDLKNDGYLTGYPMPEMNAYALSRTWLATEKPRPGCVWTHTLLIDFSDLANINRSIVSGLFVRPSINEGMREYNQPLNVTPDVVKPALPDSQLNILTALVNAIYGSPTSSIFVRVQNDKNLDDVVLAIWLQQWPRLRRNFRFCTWTASDRSRPGEKFDFQVVPLKKTISESKRLVSAYQWVDIESPLPNIYEQWAEACAQDAISENSESRLRKFLCRYGSEIEDGRSAFKPLSLIWEALEGGPDIDFHAAVDIAKKIDPTILSLTQRVAEAIAQRFEDTSPFVSYLTEFLVQNLKLVDEQLVKRHADAIAMTLWQDLREYVWPLFRSKSVNDITIAKAVSKLMKPNDVLARAGGDPDLFNAVLEINQELSASPLIWDAPDSLLVRAAENIATRGEPNKKVLYAMIEAGNTSMPEIGIRIFGQAALSAAVEYYDRNTGRSQQHALKWLVSAKEHPELLLAAIGTGIVRDIKTLERIASLVSYRETGTGHDTDEWGCALDAVRNLNNADAGSSSFYSYLLARALSGASPEPRKLILASFDHVHAAILRSRLEDDTWKVLKQELPEVSFWNEWDKGYRLRIGVVKSIIENKLSPKDFMDVTRDEYAFRKLIDIAASSSMGCDYLANVSLWAQNSNDERIRSRRELIERELGWRQQ